MHIEGNIPVLLDNVKIRTLVSCGNSLFRTDDNTCLVRNERFLTVTGRLTTPMPLASEAKTSQAFTKGLLEEQRWIFYNAWQEASANNDDFNALIFFDTYRKLLSTKKEERSNPSQADLDSAYMYVFETNTALTDAQQAVRKYCEKSEGRLIYIGYRNFFRSHTIWCNKHNHHFDYAGYTADTEPCYQCRLEMMPKESKENKTIMEVTLASYGVTQEIRVEKVSLKSELKMLKRLLEKHCV